MPTNESVQGKLSVRTQRGGIELLEQLAPEWLALSAESPEDEPFKHPDWIRAYLQVFEPGCKLELITAHVDDRLQALLPLVEQKTSFCGFPARKLRGPANVHSYRFDMVSGPGVQGDEAGKRIWESLRERKDWDLVELPDVPQGGAAESLLEAARQDGYLTGMWESIKSPYISLSGVTDASLIPRSAHFRQNLRRRLRKAQAKWNVRLSRTEKADPIALERFLQIERSGWKGERGTAIASEADTLRFYDEIARIAEQRGYFSLYLLEFGDKAVAGHFGLTYNNRYYSPKVAYDESFAEYGPGHLIVDAILRDCLQRGLQEFDFLGPSMEWKTEWTPKVRIHASCYIFQQGLLGRTLYSAKFKLMTELRKVARQPSIARIRQKWNARH